jgi:hypothetical protein
MVFIVGLLAILAIGLIHPALHAAPLSRRCCLHARWSR